MQGRDEVQIACTNPDLLNAERYDACEKFLSCAKKAWRRKNPGRKSWEFLSLMPESAKENDNYGLSGLEIDVENPEVLRTLYPTLWHRFSDHPKRPPGTEDEMNA